MTDQTAQHTVSDVLLRLAAELDTLYRESADLDAAVAELIQATSNIPPSLCGKLQATDALAQSLSCLKQFLAAYAADMGPAWQTDPHGPASVLPMRSLAHRLTNRRKPQPAQQPDSGDCVLF